MKILFITSGSIKSSLSYRALALGGVLCARGHEVTIIAPSADKYNNFKHEKIQEINGIKIIQPFQLNTKKMVVNLLPYIIDTMRIILRKKVDLVYIFKPTPISVVGFLAKFIYGVNVVLDLDDLGSKVMKFEGHPWYQQKLVEWSEKFAAKYADRIVVVSSYLMNYYKKQYPKKLLFMMPNCADPAWFKQLSFGKIKKHIVFVGGINRLQILDPLFEVLPEIFRDHPDSHATIMGDGKYLNFFKEKCISLGISDKVSFLGHLSLEDVQFHFFAGDIGYCYMPDEMTIRAASNMKVSQYMARGVLPLVSKVGDLPYMVGQGKGGYIAEPGSILSLREMLNSALIDIQREEKALFAQQFAKDNFSWEKFGELFEQWLFPSGYKKLNKKIVYIIATEVPSLNGGAPIRNLNLIKNLAEQGFAVRVFCIATALDKKNIEILQNITGVTVHFVEKFKLKPWSILFALFLRVIPYLYQYRRSGLIKEIERSLFYETPDIAQFEQINAYYAVKPIFFELKKRGVKIVLDSHNIEQKLFEQSLKVFSFPKRLIGKWILPNFIKIENNAAKEVDAILTCSRDEMIFFEKLSSEKIIEIPNGVDVEYFKEQIISTEPTVLFMGGPSYPPNEDAIRWYINEIHGLVAQKIPEYKIVLIGGNPPQWLLKKAVGDKKIILKGFVTDEREYLSRSAVCISPMRHGSGTGLKILTYMASGLPVISTTVGARGINIEDGKNIIIANSVTSFADSIIKVLNDHNLKMQLGKYARSLVVEKYDWTIIVGELAKFYKSLINDSYDIN